MGLKNGGAIFQRMMKWVLKDLSGPGWSVHVYVDDVIIGSDGDTPVERVVNHARALKATLDRLREHQLRVDPAKMRLFMEEIEFCGHVMRDGRRWRVDGLIIVRMFRIMRGSQKHVNWKEKDVTAFDAMNGKMLQKMELFRADQDKPFCLRSM